MMLYKHGIERGETPTGADCRHPESVWYRFSLGGLVQIPYEVFGTESVVQIPSEVFGTDSVWVVWNR